MSQPGPTRAIRRRFRRGRLCGRVLRVLFAGVLLLAAAAGAAELPPVKWQVAKLDPVLDPAGGTLRLALSLTKGGGPLPTGEFALAPSFGDGWGRVFWEGAPVAIVPGDKAKPATVEFAIPYPPLPVGGYIFTGRLRDAAGKELLVIRVPTGRFERFDFRRDLAWMIFGCNPGSDTHAQALRDIGFNGAGGYSMDYRFPHRWFQDHAVQVPTECYPEEAVLHPEGTAFAGFRNWFTNGFPTDGGLILSLLTEEISAKYEDPAMRAARLRLARANDWMNVPTLSRFNAWFQTDFLSWDEVFRAGFPPLNHPQFGANPIKWTADREFRDVEAPMMRAEVIRATQPASIVGPGATHSAQDAHFDSMNRRAYNNMTTLDFISPFLATQKNYGLRPGNRLFNLKAGFIDGAAYFPANEHLYWASLAVNDRLFQVYCPGDGFGALPVKPDGQVTDEGAFLQGMIKTVHGLRPVILETRSRVEPSVFWAFGQSGDPNLADALAACGVVPKGFGQPDGATRLIFAIGNKPEASFLAAARNGAGLVLQGNDPKDLADLGIEATAEPAPEAKPEKKEGEKADDNEGNAEALKSMETTAGAAKGAAEIDLSLLGKVFPGLAGVKVLGTLGGNAKIKPGSGLEEIRVGGRLFAITGPLGKGWVLFLNFRLQNMLLPNGWSGSWGASNLSLLGDSSVPERNAGLVRALFARAGVNEPFRIVDAQGRIHPFMRAFEAEPYGGGQRYLYVVSESAGRLIPNEDPKKVTMTLAHDKQFTARLQIFDPAVKAVRDLRSGQFLPVQSDAKGATVDLALGAGQGTLLSLLPATPAGTLTIGLSQGDVAGIDQVHVVLNRLDDQGAPLAASGHTTWVRFLDLHGKEVEAMSGWETGPGPHVFTAAFAASDPVGEWTVVAEDMTDGTRAQTKLLRQVNPGGLRLAYVPAGKLVRGAPNAGALRITNAGTAPLALTGLTAACQTPGVRASMPARGDTLAAGGTVEIPLTIEITAQAGGLSHESSSAVAQASPLASSGLAMVELRRGEAVLGGAPVKLPEPYTVTFEPTPYLDGDLIVTEIRGTIRTSASAPAPITIRLPAGAGGQAVEVTSPRAYNEVPFAIPLYLSRTQAQSLRGLRHEGIDLAIHAPGLPTGSVNWAPNILPLQRAPPRIGSLTGGKLAVKINNFTKTEQRVAVTLAPLPGGTEEPWQATAVVAPESSGALERAVPGLSRTIDPGLYELPLEWTAGGVARGHSTLQVEELLEQEWWIKAETVEMGAAANDEREAPEVPADARAREQAGWRRVVTQSVLWWKDLAPQKPGPGRLIAATSVDAPRVCQVRVGFAGPTAPAHLWLNREWLPLAAKGKPSADAVVLCPTPASLRAGPNRLVMAIGLPLKKEVGTSLVLQDPSTGRRDRALGIGKR